MAKRLTSRKLARLLRDARKILEPFGLDLSLYDDGVVIEGFTDPHSYTIGVTVEWTRKDNPAVSIRIEEVWWDPDTGAILQAKRPQMLDYS